MVTMMMLQKNWVDYDADRDEYTLTRLGRRMAVALGSVMTKLILDENAG